MEQISSLPREQAATLFGIPAIVSLRPLTQELRWMLRIAVSFRCVAWRLTSIATILSSTSLFAAAAATAAPPANAAAAKPVSFSKEVVPILQANCQGCHQPAKAGGKLDLTTFHGMLAEGESGAHAVVVGKPDESSVIEQITPENGKAEMPKGKPPLSASDIALMRRWIAEGAKDDTPTNSAPPIDNEHPPIYSRAPVITSVDWSPNGELLAIAGFHEVLIHKADGTGRIARLIGMSERIDSVRFSPDGTKLAVTGGHPARLGEVQIWNVATYKLLVSVPATSDELFGVSWSPDGKQVAFGATDKAVRIINAESGAHVLFQQAHDDWVLGTTYSNDGKYLVSVGRDMSAKLVEVATQRFIDNVTSITPGALKGGIQCVQTHPLRDEIIFGGADGTPRIYRMQRTTARQIGDDANQLWELPSLPGRVFGVDVTRDGSIIAAGSSLDGHGHVHVYRMEPTPKIPDDITAILHKPVPSRSSDETAKLHKHFEQGVQTLSKIDVAEGGVYSVALSPKGDRVAAAGSDGSVRIIDTQEGTLVTSFIPVDVVKPTDHHHVAASLRDANAKAQEASTTRSEPSLPANVAITKLTSEPAAIQLNSPYRYIQIIVTAELASGAKIDATRLAKFNFSQPVASVNATGMVSPVTNGNSTLAIAFGDKTTNVDVQVANLGQPQSPDFVRDVAPILARAGCNAGTCHGSQQGKNGFKLSLRGYDPVFDVRALTDDQAARRVNVASPAQSLMLLKPIAVVPHTGGQAINPNSTYYDALREWIAAGAQLNLTSPRVASISVTPQNPVIESIGARQQIRVVATYSDGSQRDVTREAFIESGNTDVVKTVANAPGLLESLRRGEAAALVRYEGQYAATTLTVMGDRSGFEWKDPPANNRIDEFVAAKLKRTKTLPSELCDDYEFVRRVYLDLTGLPPTSEQVQSFADDKRDTKAKRDELIDRLVGNPDYLDFWTNKWADLLMVNRKFLGVEGATAFRNWIHGELAANTPYDQFARKILTASGSTKANPAGSYFKTLRTPESLMENTTHLFLATRFNCNKCHDHPFERWTQDQYYHLAAYFAQIDRNYDPASGSAIIGGTAVESGQPLYEIIADAKQGEVKHLRTGSVIQPAFPFECKHDIKQGGARREELAAWTTSPNNPYFAKSYVNRLWGYLLGRGIIEPLDDIRAGNPATNPELLDYVAGEFIQSGFHTRHIMQLICKSRTYQLSVATNKWNADDSINFSHARARRLPAEVLYDAIYRTTGATSSFVGIALGTRAAALPDVGVELPDGFLGNLGRPPRESACECERSSNLQLGPVMALVSGPTVGNAISDPENAVAKMVAAVKDNSDVVKSLFLRFLNRPGRPEEISTASKMFDDLDAEHARLVADLEAYTKELGPKLAQREIERQNRLAGLQAALEAAREIAKVRQPRAEQGRQERIAKAQAALADYEKQLDAKLPEWEAAQDKETQWRTLELAEASATFNAKFRRQPDGSTFVNGEKAKGAYRVVAPIPLDKVTGIRLEALADDRLASRGPGRAPTGNFVVTEFAARALPVYSSLKLIRSWDLGPDDADWKAEESVKVVSESGVRHLFGNGQHAGVRAAVKYPAGQYLLDVVTGIRPAVSLTIQWSTAKANSFEAARSVRRTLSAGSGGSLATPIPINADSELTGIRIIVDEDQTVVPLDAIRIFASDNAAATDLKLQNAQATFNQGGYDVGTAIDGNKNAEANNGWAIAGEFGRDHAAKFELATPLDSAKDRLLELTLHQNFYDGQHSLGRFRISVTNSPAPLGFGLPPSIVAILAKPAKERMDADRQSLIAEQRKRDKYHQELQAALATQQQPLPADARVTELEGQLAAAQQPLPIDPKLQQLRRAVELSEEQLKDKRLTVAQDIVWALINNPAFLYNH